MSRAEIRGASIDVDPDGKVSVKSKDKLVTDIHVEEKDKSVVTPRQQSDDGVR